MRVKINKFRENRKRYERVLLSCLRATETKRLQYTQFSIYKINNIANEHVFMRLKPFKLCMFLMFLC